MRRVVMVVAVIVGGCGNDGPAGNVDAAVDPDPLDVTSTAAPGSLDDLHQRIIEPRCSGQPGLCHNGQFEPNLSTPALMYSYVVNRPGIEKADRLRVKPGDAATSLFIDKLRKRDVATQMPLGAEPLEEADIAAIEAWINAGALRAPAAQAAPTLNNPPRRPEIAVFDNTGKQITPTAGMLRVTVGSTIVLRHSVQDFETPDAQIPFGGFILALADGTAVALDNRPNIDDPTVGQTTFDPNAPMGRGDLLDFRLAWPVPAQLPVFDRTTNTRSTRPAAGVLLTPVVFYVDDAAAGGIFAVEISSNQLQIQ